MKKIIKNYKQTLFILIAIIIGGIIGIIFKEDTQVLKPFGDLFLNMLLIIIVPLIFLTLTTSIYKMKSPKRLSKILISTIIIFIITSTVSLLIAFFVTKSTYLVNESDSQTIIESLDQEQNFDNENNNFLDNIVSSISVNDFNKLLSKDNILALIVVSILIGLAMNMSKEKAEPLYKFLDSACQVTINFINIIMYYAPIGLGCYFATLVGTFGSSIAKGYLKTFIMYTAVSLFIFFIIYTIYAYIAGGKKGVKLFWKNIFPSSITAISTCSSAASMPVNIECTKKMGVNDDIAENVISLGTTFHKDGSVVGSVFKIMFLVYLFNKDINTINILLIALIATLLVSAVPIGGGTISEMLIITSLGFPIYALPILTIIATIIDIPATLLNVVGDSPASMLVNRIVDGKNFLEKKIKI